jgi:hypothetical protein
MLMSRNFAKRFALFFILSLPFLPVPTNAQATPPVCGGDLICIDQGWSDEQRRWWYSASQGSRLLPLQWLLALEEPTSRTAGTKFFSDTNIRRWGYIPNPVSPENPSGLPIGFAIDHHNSRSSNIMCETFPTTCSGGLMRKPWVGMTCAACHTSDIRFGGKTVRVEGAATPADFETFNADLLAVLQTTLDDDATFDRFARAVHRNPTQRQRNLLKSQLAEQVSWGKKRAHASRGEVPFGHGRIDAQGHILARIALSTRVPNQFRIPSDAPASTPFIWNTHQQDKLQWNGIANKLPNIPPLPPSLELGALARNTSEVIGVFAHIETHNRKALRGYKSSLRIGNMIGLEERLSELKSPRWPASVFGSIDEQKAGRGKALFETNCQECHSHLDWDDLRTPVTVRMEPIQTVNTDLSLACNTLFHKSKAGNFKGQKTSVLKGDVITAEDFTTKMLINASIGAVLAKALGIFTMEDTPPGPGPKPAAEKRQFTPRIKDPAKRQFAEACLNIQADLLSYKGRPLNGIWASAPYLHNGSVPTLYDLLLPAKLQQSRTAGEADRSISGPLRPEVFGVGSQEFDPVKVGFVTDPAANPFLFRVNDAVTGEPILGNLNSGHEYGTSLGEEQRLELLEYLKTL